MERLEFDYDYELVDKIKTLIENAGNGYLLISVYGKYNVIKTLLEDLISEGFSIANEIQLEDYNVSHYDKEFVLYVAPDKVNIEKIYCNDEYVYGGGIISFVHEDCSSTLLNYVDSDMVYEFGYSEEDDFDEDDCDCKCCYNCKDKEIDEKSVSTTCKDTYKVNNKYVDKETYEKELAKFEDRYLDNIRDMLVRYADFMDDWHDLLRLFY